MARVNRISTNFKKSNGKFEKILATLKATKEDFYYWELNQRLESMLSENTVNRYFDDYLEFKKFRVLLGLENEQISDKEIELYEKILIRRGMNKRNIKTKITRILRYFYWIDKLNSMYSNGEKLKEEPFGKEVYFIE